MRKLLISLALLAPLANAAEIVGSTEENRVGQTFGSGAGVLLGGAAGGPIGALVGAAIGYFSGEQIQHGSGQSGRAFLVKNDDGSLSEVRPNRLPVELQNDAARLSANN